MATTTETTDARGREVWHRLANGEWELEGVAATETDAVTAAKLLHRSQLALYRNRYTEQARLLARGWALLEMAAA
ncbi:MAG: hypothetical protein E4H44_06025 [Candidatus Aminicenantes bacterium]|nr:MAG: hypothetical protein E4H44_06025 [Candidatus Aminicenantes bacterium]HUW00850.1 hypothetical protein [Acidimicrobiales bacterium]